MSCFDVVYQSSPRPHPAYLAYQRSVPNSPLKKKCRLDPDLLLHQANISSSSSADGFYYGRGPSFPAAATDATKPDPLASAAAPPGHSGHPTSNSSGVASFSSALTSPPTSSSTSPSASSSSSSCVSSSATTSSSSASSSTAVVALKCELMTSSSAASNDDDDTHQQQQQPVMTQPIGGNGVLLTYFSEDIETNIDNHFHRALLFSQQQQQQQQQQHGGHHRFGAFAGSAGAANKSQGSSCCRQASSPPSQRSFPPSFWNTVSCSVSSSSPSSSSSTCPSSSASSSSSYHPSSGTWSSLMTSPKVDPLAAAFTVSPNPSDLYHLNTHFAASPPGAHGPIHQDPWNPYAFCPPPPPPPPPEATYRRYRHSVHEFSFTADSPCSLVASAGGGGHFGSGMRYKSLLNGSVLSGGREDPESHAPADVWRSRCYGCADMTSSHIAAGFTLTGDIELTQANLPDPSVKDVYWF